MSSKRARRLTRLVGLGLIIVAAGCGASPSARLVADLQSANVEVRLAALRAPDPSEPLNDEAIAALASATGDADAEVRRLSAVALGRCGAAARPALAALHGAVDDREPAVRLAASLAIRQIDPQDRSYEPVLTDALRAADGQIMLEVGRMGVDAAWAVPTLKVLLAHDSANVRSLAARTLGQIGPAASGAEPALKRSLRDPNVAVQDAARDALEKIQAPSPSAPHE